MSESAETRRGHAQGVEVFQRSQSSVGWGWEGAVGHGAQEQAAGRWSRPLAATFRNPNLILSTPVNNGRFLSKT